jgi:hypothetical protein
MLFKCYFFDIFLDITAVLQMSVQAKNLRDDSESGASMGHVTLFLYGELVSITALALNVIYKRILALRHCSSNYRPPPPWSGTDFQCAPFTIYIW